MTPELKVFLMDLRQHPLFPELIRSLDIPKLNAYHPSRKEPLDAVGARHCYQSGQLAQHKLWLSMLTGQDEIPETRDETTLVKGENSL